MKSNDIPKSLQAESNQNITSKFIYKSESSNDYQKQSNDNVYINQNNDNYTIKSYQSKNTNLSNQTNSIELLKEYSNKQNIKFSYISESKVDQNITNPSNNSKFMNNKSISSSSNQKSNSRFVYTPGTNNDHEIICKQGNNKSQTSTKKQTKNKSSTNLSRFSYKPNQNTENKPKKYDKNKINSNSKFIYIPESNTNQILNCNEKQKDEENITRSINVEKNETNHINSDLFIPNENLYYIYFKEKNSILKSSKTQNSSIFGVDNINDIQRGYKLDSNDSNIFTFLGFSNSLDCNKAKNILLYKNDCIDTSSISIFDDDYESSNCEDIESENEICDEDFDEINFFTEDEISYIKRNDKFSPKEVIKFNSNVNNNIDDSIDQKNSQLQSNQKVETKITNDSFVKKDSPQNKIKYQSRNKFIYRP